MHIDDAAEAGEPFGPGDVASVFVLAARHQFDRGFRQVPLVLAGLPILLLCLMAYGLVYESHFAPWDLMEETPSTDPTARWIRSATGLAWIALLPLGAFSGWRVARSVRQGRLVLPAIYVVGLVALISQADLFIERTSWFANGSLSASQVDDVSPYSVSLIALALLMPLAYLLFDSVARSHQTRKGSDAAADSSESANAAERGYDLIGIGAIIAPVMMVTIPMIPLVLFLLLTWMAPSFQLRHKVAAVAVLAAPIATALIVGGVDDPGPALFGFLGAFLVVWGWIATVALRSPAITTPPTLSDATNHQS